MFSSSSPSLIVRWDGASFERGRTAGLPKARRFYRASLSGGISRVRKRQAGWCIGIRVDVNGIGAVLVVGAPRSEALRAGGKPRLAAPL
jgi:hypothetical protein